MHKYDEFEIAFRRLCDVDINGLKKINDTGVKYFFGDTVFFILNSGNLLISSGKGKIYLNFDSWETRIEILRETKDKVMIFISIVDSTQGVDCCYESELDKVR